VLTSRRVDPDPDLPKSNVAAGTEQKALDIQTGHATLANMHFHPANDLTISLAKTRNKSAPTGNR
jgi:hypothetical protein